jgi:hypothetical protein
VARWVAIVVGLVLLVGCGDDGGEAPAVEVTATRSSLFDTQRTFRLELRNHGAEPVVVSGVRLVSPLFEAEPPADRRTEVPAGDQRLVPLAFGPSVCPPGEGDPVVEAVVDGEAVRLPLAERPAGLLADFHDLECAQAAVRDAVDLRFGDAWASLGPRSAAGQILVEPREPDADASVESVRGNIVFSIEVTSASPRRLAVVVTATRCDPHALIESKRTFQYPVEVALDEGEPVWVVLEPEGAARATFERLLEACLDA